MHADVTGSHVSQLWQRLDVMEKELRFGGESYPEGMCAFPFRLKGQGFFPGGDGLWRNKGEIAAKSDGVLPQGGVLFLGNDFGVLKSYEKLKQKGFENVLTWRNLKLRVESAEIPPLLTFFTNAIMGLRMEGTGLTQRSWQTLPGFPEFCGEFLDFQLATLQPSLTVVMGPHARTAFDALANKSNAGNVFYTSHPYADFNLPPERRAADVEELKEAWQNA